MLSGTNLGNDAKNSFPQVEGAEPPEVFMKYISYMFQGALPPAPPLLRRARYISLKLGGLGLVGFGKVGLG